MTALAISYLIDLAVSPRLLRLLTALAEYRGKQTLWAQTKPEVLKRLRQVDVIERVESSRRMENIEVGQHIFGRIVREDAAPEATDRSQAELAGYRDALALIHQNAAEMPCTRRVSGTGGQDGKIISEGRGRSANWPRLA